MFADELRLALSALVARSIHHPIPLLLPHLDILNIVVLIPRIRSASRTIIRTAHAGFFAHVASK
jgi:hypothetical protein